MFVCVSVCERERDRDRERNRGRGRGRSGVREASEERDKVKAFTLHDCTERESM